MSTQAETYPVPMSDALKTIKVSIDAAKLGLPVGCYSTGVYIPAFHSVVDCVFAVETAGASGGSATVSVGFDAADEPDNLLNDEAIASFGTLTSAAGAVVAGIPVFGTAGTHVQVGASDALLYYEIKVAALTALKMTAIITLKPTR
jgi:hypothetical protein